MMRQCVKPWKSSYLTYDWPFTNYVSSFNTFLSCIVPTNMAIFQQFYFNLIIVFYVQNIDVYSKKKVLVHSTKIWLNSWMLLLLLWVFFFSTSSTLSNQIEYKIDFVFMVPVYSKLKHLRFCKQRINNIWHNMPAGLC